MTGNRWVGSCQYRPEKLDMKLFKQMGVYKKVPRDVAKKIGFKVITTKGWT